MAPAPPDRSNVRVRCAFAIAVLAFAVSLAGRLAGAEPYPALLMPSFGRYPLTGTSMRLSDPQFTVLFVDGGTAHPLYVDVMPPAAANTPDHAGNVLETGLITDADRGRVDRRTSEWLRLRLSLLYPDREIAGVDVTWVTVLRPIDGGAPQRRSESPAIRLNFGE